MEQVSSPPLFIGIDVSKATLDVYIRPTGDRCQYTNDDSGIANLEATLRKAKPELVVMEASGGYEMRAADALQDAGLAVAVVHPKYVREFARASGKLAKTDKLDAEVIAHFGEAVRPKPRKAMSPTQRELSRLVRRRATLMEMAAAERDQLEDAHPSIRDLVVASIQLIEGHIKEVDAAIAELSAKALEEEAAARGQALAKNS